MTTATLAAPSASATKSALDASFATINWQAPWLKHLCQLDYLSHRVQLLSKQQDDVAVVTADYQQRACYSTTVVADLLNSAMSQQTATLQQQPLQTKATQSHQAHNLKFGAQDALPEGEAYERFIAATGNIPTRNNLHDLFNGSIWLTFPKTKALLNYHHIGEIAKQGIGESRGRVRDTITVFDENGAILVTSQPSIGEALIDFNWQACLVSSRDKWDDLAQQPQQPQQLQRSQQQKPNAQAAVYIFGHALLEQLLQPRKALCAHSVVINVTAEFFTLALAARIRYLDIKLAEHMHALLSQENVTPRQLAPLPILGIPHFWPANSDPSFYDDNYVFRSGRHRQVKATA